jgi:hypothetical protein
MFGQVPIRSERDQVIFCDRIVKLCVKFQLLKHLHTLRDKYA